jgi:acyl-CoA dehydrogenase
MAPFTKTLKKGLNDLYTATMWLMQNGMKNPDDAGAASTDYLHLSGLVALGYMWCRMVKAAQEKLDGGDGAKDFCENKITTGRYFMERVMPETAAHVARISSGSATMMALPAEAF